MTPQYWLTVVQICIGVSISLGGLVVTILTAIWRELKNLNKNMVTLQVEQAKFESRLDGAERILYSLACVGSNNNCIRENV